MNNIINVHDLKTNYSKYLDRVIGGEEVILGKYGKVVAKIIPMSESNKPRIPGTLKGKIWIGDDYEEPMTDLWDKLGSKK